MRRRGPSQKLSPLLLAALLPWWGCAVHSGTSAPAPSAAARMPAIGPASMQSAGATRGDLSQSQARVRELEQQLAERDRQIAAVRTAIDAQRHPGDSSTAAAPTQAAPPLQPPAQAQSPVPAQEPAAAQPTGAAQAAPGDAAASQGDTAAAPPPPAPSAPAAGPGGEPSGAAVAQAGAAAEQRLADAQKRIARLERQLAVEVKRRREVEAEMSRLLAETSAGPFEHADNVVEAHLREELGRARKEISDLRATLATERRERNDLERRYSALQAQVQATADAAARGGVASEEVEALKERQRRVLASIQQDLAASRQREAELRQSIEQSQGDVAVSAAEEVTNLRSENSALQLRLDEEHRRNGDLSAKLQLATRVTDLIYRMQSSGAQTAQPLVAVPVSDAR